jgi:hypothetical protein
MRSQREGAKGSERERERERDENEIKREVKTLTIAKLRIYSGLFILNDAHDVHHDVHHSVGLLCSYLRCS